MQAEGLNHRTKTAQGPETDPRHRTPSWNKHQQVGRAMGCADSSQCLRPGPSPERRDPGMTRTTERSALPAPVSRLRADPIQVPKVVNGSRGPILRFIRKRQGL